MSAVWRKEETNILIENFNKILTKELLNILPGRTLNSIKLKARKLKLKRSKKIKVLNRSLAHMGEKNGMFGKQGSNKGKKLSDETKNKMSMKRKKNPISMPGKLNPRYGKVGTMLGKKMSRESVLRGLKKRIENFEKLSEEEKQKVRKARKERAIKALQCKIKKETFPEKLVREILQELNINFAQEKQIGYYLCDFVIDDKIIEVQGDFWHANPLFYKEDNLRYTQKQNIKRDKSKKTYLINKKYKILYLWENDLKTNIKFCKETIMSFLISNT